VAVNRQYVGMALTLAEALRSDRLPEFIAQQEASGTPAANREAFDRVDGAAARGPASRSCSGGRTPAHLARNLYQGCGLPGTFTRNV
jgi:hypothetical protein